MPPLAAAGYHVIAPDQRGYGRTTGWDARLRRRPRLVPAAQPGARRARARLGARLPLASPPWSDTISARRSRPGARWCGPTCSAPSALMSAPFAGPPALPFDTDARTRRSPPSPTIHDELAALPRPRKHYQWYYSTRAANADMRHCPQGVHDFLRAYYHHKSADWKDNQPLPARRLVSADELAKMPTYYIMDLAEDMAATVAPEMPSPAEIAACRWLPDDELAVYSGEYERTGFQGGLQLVPLRTGGRFDAELQMFSGRTIDVPSIFISGKSDWGVYQRPGAFERMQDSACTRMLGCHLRRRRRALGAAGAAGRRSRLLLDFLQQCPRQTPPSS